MVNTVKTQEYYCPLYSRLFYFFSGQCSNCLLRTRFFVLSMSMERNKICFEAFWVYFAFDKKNGWMVWLH